MHILPSFDTNNIHKQLVEILDKYSSKELTAQEIQNLHNRDKNIKYYLKLLDEFKHSPHSTEDLFLNNLITFMGTAMQNESKDELHQILLIYLLLIASYVTDFFNTQELKDKKKHIKNMKKLFIEATQNILKTYENQISQTIKKIELDF